MDDVIFHNALYTIAFLGGDSAAMAEEQRWFAGQPEYENFGLALASDTESYAGRVGVRALAAYKDFLTLWKDADPGIPILKEAKAEYAKLQ